MKKVAIITGCAKGIGREIALELSRDGYNIIGTYNTSLKEIEKLKAKIESIGVCFDYYKLDITKEEEINKFYNEVTNKYKKIDILINNAAKSLDNEFYLKTKKEFMEVIDVNLVGPFLLIQKFSKLMDNGIIINISSTDGIDTYSSLNIDYSASKAALINLTKTLSLIFKNIKVFAICPNWVNTESIREMNPDYLKEEMNRIGQNHLIEPTQIAKEVIKLIYGNIKSGSIIRVEEKHE